MATRKLNAALIGQPKPASALAQAAAGPKKKPPEHMGLPDPPWQVGLGPKPPARTPAASAAPTAQSSVEALLKPIIDEINAAADRRSQTGTQAIQGYTTDLAGKLGAIDYTAPYAGAEQRQASVDAALQQSLAGGGTQLAGDLSSRLAAIGEPGVVNPVASGIASRGAALGTTELARGSNALGQLIANEGAAGTYGKKLPGIAGLSGLQGVKQLQSQVEGDTATSLGQIRSQVPGLVQGQLAAEAKAASDAASLDFRKQQQTDLQNYRGASLAKRGTGAPKIFGSATGGYYAVGADGAITKVVGGTGGKQAAIKIVGSDKTGRYAYDPSTGTKTLIVPPSTGSTGGTGSTQDKKFQQVYDQAVQQATKLHQGKEDLLGNKKPVVFKDAYKQVYAYYLGQGVTDATYARRQSLRALAAAGYPVRADLIPTGKADAAAEPAAYTPQGAKQTAFQIASAQYGWTGPELAALEQLGNNESGWNYQARNSSSGALGIGQALGHKLPPDYATNPETQVRWMLDYIKGRYGSPSRALAFWYSDKPPNLPQGHWY